MTPETSLQLIKDRNNWIALLLCSFIWVLPWSRTFQLSALLLAIASLYLLLSKKIHWSTPGVKLWSFINIGAFTALLLSASTSRFPEKPLELAAVQLVLLFAGIAFLHWLRIDAIWKALQTIVFLVVGFWLIDGLIQAQLGVNLFGFERTQRLGGFFSHPKKFGFYISVLCVWVLFAPQVRNKSLVVQSLAYALCLAVVLYGNTRAGWLSFAVLTTAWLWLSRTLIFEAFRRHRSLLLVAPVLLALIAIWAMSDPVVSKRLAATIPAGFDLASLKAVIPVRAFFWEQAWAQFLSHPWFGVGAGNFLAYLPESWSNARYLLPYPHQLILELLSGTGLLGAMVYSSIAVSIIVLCAKTYRIVRSSATNSEEHLFPIAPMLVLVGLWFPLNTHREFFSSEMMIHTWLCVAMIIARATTIKTEQAAAQ